MWSGLTEFWYRYLFWWLPAKDRQSEREGTRVPAEIHEPAAVSADIDAEAGIFEPPPPLPAAPVEVNTTANDDETTTDDLTAIKGIGGTTQQRLRDIGIKRYADIASAEPETIVELLRGRQTISPTRARAWIEQASALAGRQQD